MPKMSVARINQVIEYLRDKPELAISRAGKDLRISAIDAESAAIIREALGRPPSTHGQKKSKKNLPKPYTKKAAAPTPTVTEPKIFEKVFLPPAASHDIKVVIISADETTATHIIKEVLK